MPGPQGPAGPHATFASKGWSSDYVTPTFARDDGYFAGKKNTQKVIDKFGNTCTDSPASENAICIAYNYSKLEDGVSDCSAINNPARCYADWYLPSVRELGSHL